MAGLKKFAASVLFPASRSATVASFRFPVLASGAREASQYVFMIWPKRVVKSDMDVL